MVWPRESQRRYLGPGVSLISPYVLRKIIELYLDSSKKQTLDATAFWNDPALQELIRNADLPAQNAVKPAAPAPTPPAAAPVAPKRPWGAMLGGLAAGLGLAWLASSLGLGGGAIAEFMMFALLALVVMLAIGWFM